MADTRKEVDFQRVDVTLEYLFDFQPSLTNEDLELLQSVKSAFAKYDEQSEFAYGTLKLDLIDLVGAQNSMMIMFFLYEQGVIRARL
jgi:hypothetical protein